MTAAGLCCCGLLLALPLLPAPGGTLAEHLRAAQGHLDAERFIEARAELRKAISLQPALPGAYYQLGYACWKLGDVRDARQAFLKELEFGAPDPHSLYYLGRIAAAEGNLREAIGYYKRVVEAGPVLDVYERLGTAHLQLDDVTAGLQYLERALEMRPAEADTHYRLAQAYARAGRKEDADREFAITRRLQGEARRSGQQIMECDALLRTNRVAEALALAKEIGASSDPDILLALGILLGRHNLHREAAVPLRRAVELNPGLFEAHFNLGRSILAAKDHERAIPVLEHAATLRPDSHEANLLLGMALLHSGKDEEALSPLRRAADLQPGNVKLLALLGAKFTSRRYYREAIKILREAVAFQPENPGLRLLLIEALYLNQDSVKAVEEAREAVRVSPGDSRSHVALGLQLMNAGEFEEAQPVFAKAIALNPSAAEAHAGLGDSLLRQGRAEESLAHFRAALDRNPALVDAYLGFGKALLQLRRHQEAIQVMQEAVKLDPDHAQPRLILSQALRGLGQHERARTESEAFDRLNRVRMERRDRETERIWRAGQAREP
jgi:protein O-GlcNAc transferase